MENDKQIHLVLVKMFKGWPKEISSFEIGEKYIIGPKFPKDEIKGRTVAHPWKELARQVFKMIFLGSLKSLEDFYDNCGYVIYKKKDVDDETGEEVTKKEFLSHVLKYEGQMRELYEKGLLK